MEAQMINDTDDVDLETNSNSLSEGVLNGENGTIEPLILMEMLLRLDMDLAYSSEKLVNLDLYMKVVPHVDGLGELYMENKTISEVEIKKALTFDLLFCYLDSEVTELGIFLNILQTEIIDVQQKIHSCNQGKEILTPLQRKLHGSESCCKHLQEQLSEMMKQLTFLGRNLSIGLKSAYPLGENLERPELNMQIAGQRRHVLRMLEKSLAAELDLEKQLLESREREEEMKTKLSLAGQIVSDMEAFAEVALERLLEAEHSSEVYIGIAKEMMSRVQILQFNLHCLVRRERELKNNRISEEKEALEEKVRVLEEKLQFSDTKLREANSSYEACKEQLSAMENAIELLRKHVYMAESRAHDAEAKLAILTEENIELREEVGFLKGVDNNGEKVSLLEKKVRDLEVQLQNARMSSEASLEQQNMLYSAIWDMETLIEELKSKVSKAESRAENAEEQCLVLAETNLELNKEIMSLKSRSESLEECLKEANSTKVVWVKDINNGAKLISEMVVQLASERERIQKQLSSLARENKILLEELRKTRMNGAKAKQDNKEDEEKNVGSTLDNPYTDTSIPASTNEELGETPTSVTGSNQVDEPSEQMMIDDNEAVGYAISDDSAIADAAANFSGQEKEGKGKTRHLKKMSYIFAAIFVSLVSIVAVKIDWQAIYSIIRRRNLGIQ